MQRRRNIDCNAQRQYREQQRMTEQAMRAQQHYQIKQEMQQSIAKNKMQSSAKTKFEANETKAEKASSR